jgi:toxin-antitoxin system PIN domain toxin
VIVADTNFWIALSLSRHVFHAAARDWFDRQVTPNSVLFCRSTQQSLLRLLTTEAVMRPYAIPPLTNAAAWKLYTALLGDRRIDWASEPDNVEAHWNAVGARDTISPKLWMDAYLAAFAIAGGHQLVTTDKAFKQFKRLDAVVLAATAGKP